MTIAETRITPPALDESDIVHILCCRKQDGDLVFCGLPASGEAPDPVEVVCVVCADLCNADPGRCPLDGSHCPDWGGQP